MLLNFPLYFQHIVEWYYFEKCSSWGDDAHKNPKGSVVQYISLTCKKMPKNNYLLEIPPEMYTDVINET